MNRRAVLTRMLGVASASLAGCSLPRVEAEDFDTDQKPTPTESVSGPSGEVHTGCPPAPASASDVLPSESSAFFRQRLVDPSVEVAAAAHAGATYRGSAGEYRVDVYEFESRSQRGEAVSAIRAHLSSVAGVTAYVVRDRHIITGSGPERDELEALLGTSALVGRDCLRSFRFQTPTDGG